MKLWRYRLRAAVEEPDGADFIALFDRSNDFAALLAEVDQVRQALTPDTVQTLRQARKLRKSFAAISQIDFFPGEAQKQANSAFARTGTGLCASAIARRTVAGGGANRPSAIDGLPGRVWATRARPWVDRLASAWLIRRFIDPAARFLWLAAPAECPPDALGFDFDGATFSHLGSRVTFEVLAASFALEAPAIARLGQLVHFRRGRRSAARGDRAWRACWRAARIHPRRRPVAHSGQRRV